MDIDFGRFRPTPRTVWRPERPTFEPRYTLDESVFQDLRAVERADQDLRRFRTDPRATRRLLEEALARNAYGTASIEGNPLTLEDVESLLARGPEPEDVDVPEEREILNYTRFYENLPKWSPPGTPEDLLRLHATLFDGVLPDAGAYKERPNFIGRRPGYEVVFVAAAPQRVRPELENALNWLRDAPEHPLVKAQVFFHEFQSIHPFRDGNGRAGRALTTLLLHTAGYEGVRYALVDYEFNNDRDAYYGNLSRVERAGRAAPPGAARPSNPTDSCGFDYTPWIRYMSRILRLTFEGAVHRFLFREALPENLNDRQVQVAEWFARVSGDNAERRVKFNDVHAAFPQVPDRTLKRDLATLREAGVIEMEGERKGSRYRLAEKPGR